MQKHTQVGPQIQLSFTISINLSNYQIINQSLNYQIINQPLGLNLEYYYTVLHRT